MSRHVCHSTLAFILFTFLTSTAALAQQGLISGWVIEVQDESGQSMSEVPVGLNGEDPVITGSDGIVTIPFDGTEIADGTEMDVELIRKGGDYRIKLVPAGQTSEDCEQADQSENDDCDTIGGLVWGRPGGFVVSTSGTMTPAEPPAGTRGPATDQPAVGMPDSPVSIEVGGHIGQNFEVEELFFGVDGRAYLNSLPYPIAVDVLISYYPWNEFVSAFAPSFFASWVFDASPNVEVSVGPGVEFFRQSFDFNGESHSDTRTGVGVRGEARYKLSENVSPVVDAKFFSYDGGTHVNVKVGARVKVIK